MNAVLYYNAHFEWADMVFFSVYSKVMLEMAIFVKCKSGNAPYKVTKNLNKLINFLQNYQEYITIKDVIHMYF